MGSRRETVGQGNGSVSPLTSVVLESPISLSQRDRSVSLTPSRRCIGHPEGGRVPRGGFSLVRTRVHTSHKNDDDTCLRQKPGFGPFGSYGLTSRPPPGGGPSLPRPLFSGGVPVESPDGRAESEGSVSGPGPPPTEVIASRDLTGSGREGPGECT